MAAAASWMETTKLPLRELRRRYTRSELAIMGWRSSEIAANMKDNMSEHQHRQQDIKSAVDNGVAPFVQDAQRERELAVIEEKIGGFIWKAVTHDEKGNETLDLRKLSGEEMRTYMAAMGIAPIIPGME